MPIDAETMTLYKYPTVYFTLLRLVETFVVVSGGRTARAVHHAGLSVFTAVPAMQIEVLLVLFRRFCLQLAFGLSTLIFGLGCSWLLHRIGVVKNVFFFLYFAIGARTFFFLYRSASCWGLLVLEEGKFVFAVCRRLFAQNKSQVCGHACDGREWSVCVDVPTRYGVFVKQCFAHTFLVFHEEGVRSLASPHSEALPPLPPPRTSPSDVAPNVTMAHTLISSSVLVLTRYQVTQGKLFDLVSFFMKIL